MPKIFHFLAKFDLCNFNNPSKVFCGRWSLALANTTSSATILKKSNVSSCSEPYVNAGIEINGFKYKENDLHTLLAIKDQEINDLKETVSLFKPSSPPDLNAMMAIIDPPHLELNSTKPDANDEIDFGEPEEKYNYHHVEPRNYIKKQV